MRWLDLALELEPILRRGGIETCTNRVKSALLSLPQSPFHLVTDLHFTNDIQDIALAFDNFIELNEKKLAIEAIYTETNGFDINPDRWFFDIFAYSTYGGHDDYDWLSDWQSEYAPSITLTGMERLQEVYASEYSNRGYSDARDFASLLVVLRFQDLIHKSAGSMKRLRVPLLATSHDYDLIYEYDPAG